MNDRENSNPIVEAPPLTESDGPENQERRRKRLSRARDCVDSALEKENPFEASLGSMTGELFLIKAQLDEAIQGKLGSQPTLEQFQKVTNSLDMSLKVARQIDRQFQLMRQEEKKEE